MKVLKNFIQFSFLAILSLMVVSCSSDETKTADAKTSDVESTELNTRGMNRVASKAYYYKSLATFGAGGTAQMALTDLATLEGKKVNLVVLYEADAPWAEVFSTGKYTSTGDDNLNGVMSSYELAIVKQFSIDEENEGLVLEAEGIIDNPVEAARELSMIDNVLMVHVKEVPAEETVTETAANN
jgi:hypothetical protein